MTHEHETKPDTGANGNEIQQIACRKCQRFPINDSRQFAKSDDRPCCRDRANKDAKEDFDLMNDNFNSAGPPFRKRCDSCQSESIDEEKKHFAQETSIFILSDILIFQVYFNSKL